MADSDRKDNRKGGLLHGGYSHVFERAAKGELDGRTLIARAAKELKEALINDLGGEDRISTSERIIIDRAVVKTLKAQSFETLMLEGEPMSKTAEELYLSITNSLRKDLSVIGFERRARPVQQEEKHDGWDLSKLTTEELVVLRDMMKKNGRGESLTTEEMVELNRLQQKAGPQGGNNG